VEAVVLAGGLGTRLRAAVSDVPKPMAPVQGRPFLERLLDYWIGQGVQRAVLAVGYMHETVRKHFGEQYRNCAIDYSVEQQPLGTGGALVQTLPLVQGKTFLVLNGDTYFAVPLAKLTSRLGPSRPGSTNSLDDDHAFPSPNLDLVRQPGLLEKGLGQANSARVSDLNQPGPHRCRLRDYGVITRAPLGQDSA